MAYISSNANRWYCAKEASYGMAPTITAANRIPAVKLSAQQQMAKSQRKDKTGSRTWAGNPAGMRRQTNFSLTSYMRDWPSGTGLPAYGPLFEAVMGQPGAMWGGGNAAGGSTTSTIRFASPHGLAPGQAVSSGAEIRFVAAVADPMTVVLNAPFSAVPAAGAPLGPTATYSLGSELPSVTLFDYWDPVTAVQRVLAGAAMNTLSVELNGDFQDLKFGGMAQDIIDSSSFQSGEGGLTTFPAEPTLSSFSYSPVPGNLGQVWLGVLPTAFLTVSSATINLNNNINMRTNEFGSSLPRGIAPGAREVTMTLELFGQDDEATTGLYQAARQLSPLSVMFQTGQTSSQLMGVYVKSIVPDLPQFDDTDQRLKWKFSSSRAQGTANDELVVAFA
jgi:hypothetical protein